MRHKILSSKVCVVSSLMSSYLSSDSLFPAEKLCESLGNTRSGMDMASGYVMTANRRRERSKKYVHGRESNTGRAAGQVKNTNTRPTTAQPKLSYMIACLIYEFLDGGALAAYEEKYVFDCYRTSSHSHLSATSCGCHKSTS
jgi:hypothetical protein